MAKPPNAGSQQPGEANGWIWAVRVSLLIGLLACLPLVVVDSPYFVVVLAADLVLGGWVFKQPGKKTLNSCVIVGGLAFFFLGLPQTLVPALGFSWEFSLAFTIAHLSLAFTAAEAQERLDDAAPLAPGSTGDPRWISTVYALTVISTVPAWAIAAIAFVASRRGPFADKSGLYWLALLPVFLPHLDILWHMKKRTRSRGLGLAVAMGVGWVLVAAFPVFVSWDFVEKIIPWIIVFAVLQIGLSIVALKTFRTMAPTHRDQGQILRGFALLVGYALMGVVILILASAGLSQGEGRDANRASAVASIRIIVTAEITYSAYNDGNFSSDLATLGRTYEPPKAGTEQLPFIDALLASGTKNRYTFSYTPGPPDATGHVTCFTVTARPATYGESGCVSYFSDESGVIRSTRDDRPAAVRDPQIGG